MIYRPPSFTLFPYTTLFRSLAGGLGIWLSNLLQPNVLEWILGVGFIAMALWMLIPDEVDDDEVTTTRSLHSVFLLSFVTFFIAEMGDKTQIATLALAAEYQLFWAVVLGTTLGMVLVNGPTVFIGNKFSQKLPMHWLHRASAAVFLVLGCLALIRAISG